MSQLVDLDQLLDDFQKLEAESKDNPEKIISQDYFKLEVDDVCASRIEVTPSVSKPLCDTKSPHSSSSDEVGYPDKASSKPKSHDEAIISADKFDFSPPLTNCNVAKEIAKHVQSVKEFFFIPPTSSSSVLPDCSPTEPAYSLTSDQPSAAPLEHLQIPSAETETVRGTSPASCDTAQSSIAVDPNEEDSSDESGGINITLTRRLERTSTSPQPTSASPAPYSPFAGLSPPEWAADTSSPNCVSCGARFTVLRRRHHCRICGRLLCASCTPHRIPLPSEFATHVSLSSQEESLVRFIAGSSSMAGGGSRSDGRLHRVCVQCFRNVGDRSDALPPPVHNIISSTSAPLPLPPIETEVSVTTVPLANTPQRRRISRSFAIQRLKDECLIPSVGTSASRSNPMWPPLVISTNPELVLEANVSNDRVSELLSSDIAAVTFAITRNLHVRVSIITNGQVWSLLSHGLYTVGQEEVCLLLRRRTGEALPPVDCLWHYFLLYQLAFSQDRGNGTQRQPCTSSSFPFDDGSLLLLPNPDKLPQQDDVQQRGAEPSWFDGACCGFLYTHPNYQVETLSSLLIPSPPFLFAITLRSSNEAVIASRHPLRLLLALNQTSNGSNLSIISDRDRQPLFASDSVAGLDVLSISDSGSMRFLRISEMNILATGLGNSSGELKLQLLFRRSSHEHVRRSLQHIGHEDSLLLGLAGTFCSNADCHLVIADSTDGLTTKLTSSFVSDASELIVGASFILLQAVERDHNPCLSIVEDGFVAQLTKEQFKALLSHIRSASPLQIRIKSVQPLPDSLMSLFPPRTSASNNGALITLDWVDESLSMHPTSLHYSCIDGRPVEPRFTFTVPRELQLRHWLIRLNLSEPNTFDDLAPASEPRIAWTRLHSLGARPVYAVDNRSGGVLDFFAVFNAVAATFINALFPHSLLLRKANHRSISLRIILQPPNTFNFFIGSDSSFLANPSALSSAIDLSPCPENSDWWKVIDIPKSQERVWTPPGPLISEPAYINGLDSSLISLLDGLVHNISCSWFFDAAVEQPVSAAGEDDELAAPGLVLEFDFDILD